MKNIKQNEKYMGLIRIENTNRYESNYGEILHTDATSPDFIARITIVPEIKSTGCLNESMVIGDGLNNKFYVVDMFPYTYPGNNIPSGTDWVNRVDKCNNGSTTILVKLDIDGLIYHNIPLKYVTKFDILKIMNSEPQKNRQCCDNLTKKDKEK